MRKPTFLLALLLNVLSANAGDVAANADFIRLHEVTDANPNYTTLFIKDSGCLKNDIAIKDGVVAPSTSIKVYPNPASSYVIITYELKTPSPVVIEFVNMNGRIVKTFGQQSGAGQQRVNVALTNFPSGIYTVRIVADGAVDTKKLVIY